MEKSLFKESVSNIKQKREAAANQVKKLVSPQLGCNYEMNIYALKTQISLILNNCVSL